jgi:hypothetical protein
MDLIRSDIELIKGSFQPRCEGVVFFMWDNSHDWYLSIYLSVHFIYLFKYLLLVLYYYNSIL